ncbi:MAG: PorT family protein [Saprospiraceae bacterium]|nr:PorT family protein [Saprospiraceae bacterium]
MHDKNMLFLAAFLLLQASIAAQSFSAGARVGYTLSNVEVILDKSLRVNGSDFVPDAYYRTLGSFHAGAEVRVPISERLSFLGGIMYAQKGFKTDFSSILVDQPLDFTIQLRYFNLPLLADYRLWKGLSAQVGVEPGLLNAAWLKFDGGRSDLKDGNTYENFDLGLAGGLEWRFDNGLFFSSRYIYGVLPIANLTATDENGIDLGRVRSYNRSVQFAAGYRVSF